MHPLVNIGISAARAAGRIMLRHLDRVDQLRIDRKGHFDFVSDVDRAAEQEVIDIIHRAYPSHAILAEESDPIGDHDIEWIIDPVDGTTNYLHKIPHFCVSIGVREKGELAHGVVYDPIKDEMFTASRGQGALLNRRRIRVSATKHLDQALIATGEPVSKGPRWERYQPQLLRMIPQVGGIRRAGSAALDLAYVAAGRLDGYWELGLQPWDMAAGIVLVQEAGGTVEDLDGQDVIASGNILASNPRLLAMARSTING